MRLVVDNDPSELDEAWAEYDSAMLILQSMYGSHPDHTSPAVRRAQAEEAVQAWQRFRDLLLLEQSGGEPEMPIA